MSEVTNFEEQVLGPEMAEMMAAMSLLSDVQEMLGNPGDLADSRWAVGVSAVVTHAKIHLTKAMQVAYADSGLTGELIIQNGGVNVG
jgi:hypothetical protein